MHLFRRKFQTHSADKTVNINVKNREITESSEPIKKYGEEKLVLTGCVVSDVGCVRANNEDNFLLDVCMNDCADKHSQARTTLAQIDGSWHIFCVFDGMGGGEKGELASGIASNVFRKACARLRENTPETEIDTVLRKCFMDSNNEIVLLQQKFKIYGTTGTVLCTNGIDFKIYHLGDSRAYLLRDGQMFQITRDQTLAQMKIDVGLYDENDPKAETERHKLTEYIGRDWTRENIRPVESEWMKFQPDDRILLCSDGLYDMCTDADIIEILEASISANEAAANLVDAAIAKGGEDNVTCIVLILS